MADGSGCVVFDVRGRLFKVLPELVRSQPSTLLAQLLDDVGTDTRSPIFVDANPDRFGHILDFYRYGEMFPPADLPVAALLHDAVFLMLPDAVRVNGRIRRLSEINNQRVCTRDEVVAGVLARWPGFDAYLDATMARIRAHFEEAVRQSDKFGNNDYDEYADQDGFKMILRLNNNTGLKTGWFDPISVCNMQRASVLQVKLEEQGLLCDWVYSGDCFEGFAIRLRAAHAAYEVEDQRHASREKATTTKAL